MRRVRLVRVLIETGGLSIAASREVLKGMDANLGSPAYFLEDTQHALDGFSTIGFEPSPEYLHSSMRGKSKSRVTLARAGYSFRDVAQSEAV